MQRGALVGIIVGVLLVGGVGAAVAVSALGEATPDAVPGVTAPAGGDPTDAEGSSPDDESSAPDETAGGGSYVEYSDAALAEADGARVLFFHAPWCPQCRALEEDIEAAGVPDGITILKVDYDSRQDLRQRYDVTLQTTLVLLADDADGAQSFVAYDDPTLAASLAGLGLTG